MVGDDGSVVVGGGRPLAVVGLRATVEWRRCLGIMGSVGGRPRAVAHLDFPTYEKLASPYFFLLPSSGLESALLASGNTRGLYLVRTSYVRTYSITYVCTRVCVRGLGEFLRLERT